MSIELMRQRKNAMHLKRMIARQPFSQRPPDAQQTEWLFNYIPTVAQWRAATPVRVGRRGVNNPEIVEIDGHLALFHDVTRTPYWRKKGINDSMATIQKWIKRRGSTGKFGKRQDAMMLLNYLIPEVIEIAFYDSSTLLDKIRVPQQNVPDRVECGFHELGATAESCRVHLVTDIFKRNNKEFLTNNEVFNQMQGYGLLHGRSYHGGGACHSAPGWAKQAVLGQIQRPNNNGFHQIQLPISAAKNGNDTHRFAKDANNLLIDPTWRQFHTYLCKPQSQPTPAIFVGTLDEMKQITGGLHNVTINKSYAGCNLQ
jgi:hypothetical protein